VNHSEQGGDSPAVIESLRETWNQPAPGLIFFDAMGTLFDLRQSLGDIYGAVAAGYGVKAEPEALTRSFFQAFASAPPLAFGDCSPAELNQRERDWWRGVVRNTFAGAVFSDFDAFFTELYDYFADPAPWRVYEDVPPTLEYWRDQGVPLVVLSNFDSRLTFILTGLGLRDYFAQVVVSSHCVAAKPDPRIFQQALAPWDLNPSQVWHLGDSFGADYQGAQKAGLQAFWLQRR
jgi:putative hydrolase of the HAD superfamily